MRELTHGREDEAAKEHLPELLDRELRSGVAVSTQAASKAQEKQHTSPPGRLSLFIGRAKRWAIHLTTTTDDTGWMTSSWRVVEFFWVRLNILTWYSMFLAM